MAAFPGLSSGPQTSSSSWTSVRSIDAASSARGEPPTMEGATCGLWTSTCMVPGSLCKPQSLGLHFLGKVFTFLMFGGDGEAKCLYFRGKNLLCSFSAFRRFLFKCLINSHRQVLPRLPPTYRILLPSGLGMGLSPASPSVIFCEKMYLFFIYNEWCFNKYFLCARLCITIHNGEFYRPSLSPGVG